MAKRKLNDLIVKPASRKLAEKLCKDHSHARSLPNTAKYNMVAYINGRPAGLCVWGYGIKPAGTPNHLFGEAGKVEDYLELSRFFVYDWTPKYTASKFLSITHRLLKQYTDIKWLYTYSAGFQGLIGTIYQASNYDYIGRQKCQAFTYIPNVGLVHSISLWHRYSTSNLQKIEKIFPGAKKWVGYNFRYIYWLCSDKEKKRLMKYAKFEIKDRNPDESDLDIWLEDINGNKKAITPKFAKEVPVIKLPSRRKNK